MVVHLAAINNIFFSQLLFGEHFAESWAENFSGKIALLKIPQWRMARQLLFFLPLETTIKVLDR